MQFLLREADKEMLEVLPEDIIASPRSVPLGMFDSRKFEFSFGEKFLDSSMEDSVALPVFTPMNFWRCVFKNEALVQCNQNFSCPDSSWHCMIVCEGSVIRANDSDQLWCVLEVTPAWYSRVWVTQCRSSTSQDTLKSMVLSGPNVNIGDRQDWSAVAVIGVHRAFMCGASICSSQNLYALHCTV